MNCPRCKTKVSKDDAICPNCNLKLIFKCPRCASPSRLGSVSCKKCGYTFVKFCPQCHSANYATSSVCRKCGHEFNDDMNAKPLEFNSTPEILKNTTKPKEEKSEKLPPKKSKTQQERDDTLIIYVDLTNIERIFEKYNTDEFKQKVVQNIKTTIKIAFGAQCEFVSERHVRFNVHHPKGAKILDKIEKFREECDKFNQILEKTLDCGVTYKFAITTMDEIRKNHKCPQLMLGSDKDVVVSSGAYLRLSSELSLIKISQDSYKMVFLEQKPVFEQSEDEKYDKALEIILNNVNDNNSDVRAISINAPRGAGKTHLLNDLNYNISKMNDENLLVFYACCSALTQISSFGLIQNFFISFFDCPTILDKEFNIKEFEQIVLKKLGLDKIEEEKLETLANLIYPLKKDYFENILINKEITHKYLQDIFYYIKQKKNVIFIIDDFDLIDESSFAFIKHLVNEDYFERNAKLILSYKNSHSIAIYFQSNKLNSSNCLNISLSSFNHQESKEFIKKTIGKDSRVPSDLISQIAYSAQGNIAYIEQVLHYLFEQKIFYIKDKVVTLRQESDDVDYPQNLEDCFYKRLDFLKEKANHEFTLLMAASLLGDVVNREILMNVFNYDERAFFEIIKNLEKKGYLKRKTDDIYGFKNSLTWSYCYIKAKEDSQIKEYAKKLLDELKDKTISSPLINPILAQISQNYELAYKIWSDSLQYANYIGDINIYTMAQKQCLILLENTRFENLEEIKNNICERLGKITYIKNPSEAKDYLTNAIVAAQKTGDINKVIDLSGYLVKSLYLIQDYIGVVDIVDNILKHFSIKDKNERRSNFELQVALIKTRKLEAMLALGHWEQISSIVNTEINPALQKHLHIFAKNKWITQSEIYYSWIESNIILALSYCEQGSPLAFELIDEITKFLSREKGRKVENLKVRLAYARAIANTAKGYFDESDKILQEILTDYSYVIDSPIHVCKWNIINIINKILKGEYEDIKDDLFEATSYADNCGDEYSKNLLKTLLAYIFLEEKLYLKAIEIATEQMQYFSSKKIAFGALLAWYISAAATANNNKADMYCIEICEKAVKICENAENNNFYFKIMFQELLVKIYLKLGDYENASMYCDLALQGANANELLYLQVRLNALKAKIAREKINKQPDEKKKEYAQHVIKMYNRTIEMAQMLNLKNTAKIVEKDLTSFRAHCQLNRIIEG